MSSVVDVRDFSSPDGLRKFPYRRYPRASSFCSAYLDEFARAAQSIDWEEVDRAVALLVDAYGEGRTVFSCGNGGSAAIANHLECDHLKGIRTGTGLYPRVISLNANVELLTAVSNDIGYEEVFSYQLQSQARPDDVLMAISSSGRSQNILKALSWARDSGMHTIALTGFQGGDARELADIPIHVDCNNYGLVEDLHQAVMHAIAQFIRQSHMNPASIPASTF